MSRTPTTTTLFRALLPFAAALASACSGFGTTPAPGPPPVTAPAAAAVPEAPPTDDRQIADLQRRIADLELRLLEKGAQVEELQTRLDDARREVVRAMAKLQSQATRAEAASGIAEAELALQSLPATAEAQAVAEVRQLMTQAGAEF